MTRKRGLVDHIQHISSTQDGTQVPSEVTCARRVLVVALRRVPNHSPT